MTTVPWYAYLLILFLPLLINTVVSIYIQLVLKRINRQENNPPWTYKKSLLNALVIGAPMGALTQMLLQEALSPYVYLSEASQWNLVIFAAVFSPWLIMSGYSAALWYTKRKGHTMLYEYLRIRHKEIDYPDEDSDFTIKHYHNSSLNGNDIKEE
jgi:hypothetical protein|tara:strand:- start:482 stop:946 length:465 start_codon:yes stop_codon:yes gene_type:complete